MQISEHEIKQFFNETSLSLTFFIQNMKIHDRKVYKTNEL